MKLSRNYIETFIFIIVYLFAIYFWSQPYQETGIPYGEYDAMSHFEVADWMAYNDKSLTELPHYIDIRYGKDNKYKPHTLWYPPTFHSSLAFAEVFSGERFVSIYLWNTILSTFVIITTYFVINSLFGFLPAILSSLLIIFSPRDFMPYLWGQWPERFAYAFIPIVLYCLYRYFISYSKEKSSPAYIYLAALFLGIDFLVHPLVFFHSLTGTAVLYIFLSIKQKKLVFSWKHISVSVAIILVLFLAFPNQTFNVFPRLGTPSGDVQAKKPIDLSRLLQWSLNPNDFKGSVPPSYFSYKEMHGLWTLPFLLIGIAFLVFRREERDILLLAWLVSLYFVMHRDIIGQASFLHRSLSATAHIFAPLTAIGAVYLSSAVKLPNNYNSYLKYGLAGLFIYLAFSINMAGASAILNKKTYHDYTSVDFLKTLTPEQLKAGQWELENIPVEYNVTVLGIPHQSNILSATAYKIRWLAAVSQHVNRFYFLVEDKNESARLLNSTYALLDYTMLGPIGDKETFAKMQEIEKTVLANRKMVYNENNIRVYEIEHKK